MDLHNHRTLIKFPPIIEYAGFSGDVIFPTINDYFMAYEMRRRLMPRGRVKGFSDILIASIAINNGEELATNDKDIGDITDAPHLN